jgi:Septum formation
MAAPAGVGSGSVPEPETPEPAATEPLALEAAVPEPSRPAPGESTAAVPKSDHEPAAVPKADHEPAAVPEADHQPAAGEPPAKRRGVSWLVVAGVILVLVAAAAAAGVLAVVTHGFRPKTVVTYTYRPAAVYGLRAGDCVNASPNGLSVTILSCATPHQAEVFATFSLTGSSWPGSAGAQQQASSGCANRIAGYLNPQLLNAGLTEQYVYPDQDAWQAGVRTVVCEVSSTTGPLSGSVRNGG